MAAVWRYLKPGPYEKPVPRTVCPLSDCWIGESDKIFGIYFEKNIASGWILDLSVQLLEHFVMIRTGQKREFASCSKLQFFWSWRGAAGRGEVCRKNLIQGKLIFPSSLEQ